MRAIQAFNGLTRLSGTVVKLLQENKDEGYCKTKVSRFENKESVVFFTEVGKYPKKPTLV